MYGQRALKLQYGAGHENITVLGVCSAADVVMDTLIICKAKNTQSSWYGDKALPNTYYEKSENSRSIEILCNIFDLFLLVKAILYNYC